MRPKLLSYVKEYYYFDLMQHLQSPESIAKMLKDPLSLRIMRQYF